jgi:hypothetical protein
VPGPEGIVPSPRCSTSFAPILHHDSLVEPRDPVRTCPLRTGPHGGCPTSLALTTENADDNRNLRRVLKLTSACSYVLRCAT